MRKNMLLWILALSSIFFILHVISLAFSLYWIFPSLDYLMHAIGGSIIGLISLVLCSKKLQSIICALCLGILFSCIWEYVELAINATFVRSGYYFDTIMDIVVGVGASVSIAYLFFTERHE